MAFDTNCRVDPVPFAILKILTNTDASGSGLGWVVCISIDDPQTRRGTQAKPDSGQARFRDHF